MSCLPETGGCERLLTDPFVNYLNAEEARSYTYEQCLDKSNRNTSQPETLYRDRETSQILVIERKTIVWPIDCIETHKIEHEISDIIYRELHGKFLDDYYQLKLPSLSPLKPKKEERELLASKIVANLLGTSSSGCPGGSLMGYGLTRLDRSEVEPNQGRGVTICWSVLPMKSIDPCNLPPKLEKQLAHVFDACRKKFQSYISHRRILMIEPQGDLYFRGQDWWNTVFRTMTPPIEIGEIWQGVYDFLDDLEQGWSYEKLFNH